jgi:hypothetical protein
MGREYRVSERLAFSMPLAPALEYVVVAAHLIFATPPDAKVGRDRADLFTRLLHSDREEGRCK